MPPKNRRPHGFLIALALALLMGTLSGCLTTAYDYHMAGYACDPHYSDDASAYYYGPYHGDQ